MHESRPGPTPEEIAQVREQVAGRVQEEGAAASDAAPVIDHVFVKRCLYAGQKGDGLMYAALNRGKLLNIPTPKGPGIWYEWSGAYWKEVTIFRAEAVVESVVSRYEEARALVQTQIAEAKVARDNESEKRLERLEKRLRKNVDDLREGSGVTAALRFALSNEDPLLARMEDFDADPHLLGVANGVVDLHTGEFRAARPTDMIRRTCDVE